MHVTLSVALGVCIGLIITIFVLWIASVITQYLYGNRYFAPSEHIIKEKLFNRLKIEAYKSVKNQEKAGTA